MLNTYPEDDAIKLMNRKYISNVVHRLANIQTVAQYAATQGLSIEDLEDINELVSETICPVERAFTPTPTFPTKYGEESRFSDGTWPVYYTALSRNTAQIEAACTYARLAAGNNDRRRPVYYHVISCRFGGQIVDLRDKREEWPELFSENHTFCQQLAKQGVTAELEAFLAPSARDKEGTCVPIFVKKAISNVSAPYGKSKISFNSRDDSPVIEEMDAYQHTA